MTEEAMEPGGSEETPVEVSEQGSQDPVDAGFFNDQESLARQRGWKSADEWKGDLPPSFVDDPAEFNSRFEERMPSLLSENRGLREQVATMDRALSDMADWRASVDERHAKDIERAKADVETKIRQAAQLGDAAGVEELVKHRDSLNAQTAPQQQATQDANHAFDAWVQSDDAAWYREAGDNGNDPRIVFGRQIGEQLEQQGYRPDTPAYYREISLAVQDKFKPTPPARVEGGERQAPRGRPTKIENWSQLPAEVKNSPHVIQQINKIYMKVAKGDEAKARTMFAQDYAQRMEANNG